MLPTRIRRMQALVAFAGILGSTFLAGAHQFWVRPGSFTATEGGLGRFYLMHGHHFENQFVPRNEPYIERFELLDALGAQRIIGQHGQPTNLARFRTTGSQVVVYESQEVRSELGPERFAAYLAEEGLDGIARQREALGETQKDGIEVYVRCAKALVTVVPKDGTASEGPTDRVAGLPMEIVLQPLGRVEAGQRARVRVLFGGQPLPDARILAVCQAHDGSEAKVMAEVRTDTNGMASIELSLAGSWMFTSVHMIRTNGRTDADWKSYWASLTFETAAGAEVTEKTKAG